MIRMEKNETLSNPMTKLLIVEADDFFRSHLTERLHVQGFEVFPVGQVNDAGQILQYNVIDVVLLGKLEFKQDGLNLLKDIKKLKPLTEVILMIPSDDTALFTSIQAMKLGAFDDIRIPFDMNKLIERIQAAGKRKIEREKNIH